MKLLADLSLLSSPYTWMTPPGRAPSPDVGDVLLAGEGGCQQAHTQQGHPQPGPGRGQRQPPGQPERARQALGLTPEPEQLASVQDHGWQGGAQHGRERREVVTGRPAGPAPVLRVSCPGSTPAPGALTAALPQPAPPLQALGATHSRSEGWR